MEERRLCNIQVPTRNQLLHVTVEESQQQSANMGAINIGIAHNHDTTIAQPCNVELLANPHADRRNDIFDLLVFQHLVEARTLHIQDLTAQRQDSLEVAVASLLGGATRRITLDQVQFAAVSVFLRTVGKFARQRRVQSVLALNQLACSPRRFTCSRGGQALLDDEFGLARRLFQVLGEHIRRHHLNDRPDLRVVQLGLCLRLKLWIGQFNAKHSRQTLAHIVTRQVAILLLEEIHLARVVVKRTRERAAEAGNMHTAINGVNAVGEGKFCSGPAIVVLYRQLDLHIIDLASGADRARLETAAVLIQVAHKGDQPTFKVKGRFAIAAFVIERDCQAAVEIGHLAKTLRQHFKAVVARLHHCQVR